MTTGLKPLFWQLPSSRLGWWAVSLTAANLIMSIFNSAVLMQRNQDIPEGSWIQVGLILYGMLMLLCGLAGGIIALIALIRNHERSWLVWLTLLPGAFVVFLLLGEFLFPH